MKKISRTKSKMDELILSKHDMDQMNDVINDYLFSLEYSNLLEQMEIKNATGPERKKIIMATEYIRMVLREALKSTDTRKEEKVFSYLKMAMGEIDKFYSEKESKPGNNYLV